MKLTYTKMPWTERADKRSVWRSSVCRGLNYSHSKAALNFTCFIAQEQKIHPHTGSFHSSPSTYTTASCGSFADRLDPSDTVAFSTTLNETLSRQRPERPFTPINARVGDSRRSSSFPRCTLRPWMLSLIVWSN